VFWSRKIEMNVLVTTEFRGVFFGELAEDNSPGNVVLKNARNCIYWSSDVGGFLGLAAKGPSMECRIGFEVESVRLFKITSITPVSSEAVEKWKSA